MGIHVVPRLGQKWAVIKAGRAKALSLHQTAAKATVAARELGRALRARVYIHGTDGRIRRRYA